MKEIGGYIELDNYHLPMVHDGAIALNCGRNCLAYILQARKIHCLYIPYFLCDSISELCKQLNVEVKYYRIRKDFLPEKIAVQKDEWVYLVNYYGQLSPNAIKKMVARYEYRVVLDNAQAYFEKATEDVDTIYTCRKFFGVPDGGFLYTNQILDMKLEQDLSYERMHFLLGRYEQGANLFYEEYVKNNKLFSAETMKTMSKLTQNLLHGIDYKSVKQSRTDNYAYLFKQFKDINRLDLREIEGAFAYPLWIKNGVKVRKQLQQMHIYIPTLWPNVLSQVEEDSLEYDMVSNILPIPVDQRYDLQDMEYIVKEVLKCID